MKEKRSTKAKSEQLAQVTIVAKSLVCDASSTLDTVGALRLHAPNKHIPLISTLFLVLHLFDSLKSKRARVSETALEPYRTEKVRVLIHKTKTLAVLRAFNGIFRIFIIFYYNFFFISQTLT